MGTISVVIPVYNDAAFLATALAALAGQVRAPDEVIVVDNASTDSSARVAHAAGARVAHEPVHGIWPAAARGYDLAHGDVIARLDADSIPGPDWLLRIEQRLLSSPEVAVVTGPGDFYGCSTVVATLGNVFFIGGYRRMIGLWLAQPPIFGSNFAMRREVWLDTRDRVHRTNDHVHDDIDLSLHLGAAVTVVWDRTLRVGISARPFDTFSSLLRRAAWGRNTLVLHWPEMSPLRLRRARRRFRVQGAPPRPTRS